MHESSLSAILFSVAVNVLCMIDYMTGRGTVNIAVKTAWGCIVLAYIVIAWGILCSRREGMQWRRRASDSYETPPIDLLELEELSQLT